MATTISRLSALLMSLLLTMNISAQRTVTGTVTDENGSPLQGAVVTVADNAKLGTTTDAAGTYRLTLPTNEKYTLTASFMGCIPQSKVVPVVPADAPSQPVDFILEEDAIGLETVVVTGTRTPKLLKDAPIITRVISEDEIRKTDATTIADLLQTELPGIEFSYAMNQQVNLNMQGFGGTTVLFLVDGERLAGETLDNVDYSRLNLDNVGRVEIVKGAASALYGSNAVGGVINLISKE